MGRVEVRFAGPQENHQAENALAPGQSIPGPPEDGSASCPPSHTPQLWRGSKNALCQLEVNPYTSNPSGSDGSESFRLESEEVSQSAGNPLDAALLQVWDHYIVTLDRDPKLCIFTDKRKSMGRARLRELMSRVAEPKVENAVTLMKLCVDRLAASDFHNARGKYKGRKKYRDWEILFRSPEQMEKWLDDDSYGDGE